MRERSARNGPPSETPGPGAGEPGCLALLVAAAVLLGAPASCDADTESLYGKHVVARFPRGARELAHVAVGEADQLAVRLQTDLGVRLGERAELVICPTHADFERAAGKEMPVWVLGLAVPEQDRVILKELPPLSFRKLVRHEVVHLYVGRALGSYSNRAPRWLHEGTAKYYSGDWSGQEMGRLSDAERAGKLHRIAELRTFPTDPQRATIAYAESYMLVEYLISLDPQRQLDDFIVNLKETEDVGRAFRRAYGMSEEQIEAGWRELIAQRSRPIPRPWAVEGLIFFAMVVIFMVAVWRVRRRSREIRERMEQEELLERLFEETRRRSP
jgi:hypothetical protein